MSAVSQLVKVNTYRNALLDVDLKTIEDHLKKGANASYVEGDTTTHIVIQSEVLIQSNTSLSHLYTPNKIPNAPIRLVISAAVQDPKKRGQLLGVIELLLENGADPNVHLQQLDSHYHEGFHYRLNRKMFAEIATLFNDSKEEVKKLATATFKMLMKAGTNFRADWFMLISDSKPTNIISVIEQLAANEKSRLGLYNYALNLYVEGARKFLVLFNNYENELADLHRLEKIKDALLLNKEYIPIPGILDIIKSYDSKAIIFSNYEEYCAINIKADPGMIKPIRFNK